MWNTVSIICRFRHFEISSQSENRGRITNFSPPSLPLTQRASSRERKKSGKHSSLAPCLRLFSAVCSLFIRYKYANKPLLLFKERAKPNQHGSGNCSRADTGNGKWCFHYKISEKQLWKRRRNGEIQATTNWEDKKYKTRSCSTQEEKKLQWMR